MTPQGSGQPQPVMGHESGQQQASAHVLKGESMGKAGSLRRSLSRGPSTACGSKTLHRSVKQCTNQSSDEGNQTLAQPRKEPIIARIAWLQTSGAVTQV